MKQDKLSSLMNGITAIEKLMMHDGNTWKGGVQLGASLPELRRLVLELAQEVRNHRVLLEVRDEMQLDADCLLDRAKCQPLASLSRGRLEHEYRKVRKALAEFEQENGL